MSQAKLAEVVGVSPQQISKIVKGHENLTLETIYKLSRALGEELIAFPVYKHNYVKLNTNPIFIGASNLEIIKYYNEEQNISYNVVREDYNFNCAKYEGSMFLKMVNSSYPLTCTTNCDTQNSKTLTA